MTKRIFLLIITVFLCSFVYSQSTQWIGNIDSDWNKSGNWSNGVPTVNSTVVIANIPYGNSQPILNSNTLIQKLNLGDNNQTLKITNGVTLEVTQDVLLGESGTVDIESGQLIVNQYSTLEGILNIDTGDIKFINGVQVKGNVIMNEGSFVVGQENTSFVDFTLSNAANFNLNDSNLTIYGSATFNGTSTSFNAGNGEIFIYGNSLFNGGSNFNLEQANIDFFGTSTFNASFNSGSGELAFYDDVIFSWGSFNANESTALFTGNFSIGNNNAGQWGPTGIFNNVEISEGSSITGSLPLTVTGDFINNGTYYHLSGTSIDIYGDIIGSDQMNSDYPFVIALNEINTTTVEVTFNEALLPSSISSINGGTAIKNGHQNTSTPTNQLASVVLKSGTDNVLIFNFTSSIDYTSENNYLWINSNLEDLDGNALRSPYIKQIKKLNNVNWTGNISSNWDEANNWQDDTGILNGSFPDHNAGYNIIFDNNASHNLILPEDVVIGDYINSSTKSLDLNGNTMKITGNILVNGNGQIIGNGLGSKLIFESEFNQTIPQDLLYDNTLDNLTISSPGNDVVLEGELNLTGILTLNNGVFITQDHLTLKSYLNKTAILAPVENGTIIGEVTIERYLPAKRAFRFITSSVTTTTSIRENWQEGVNNLGLSTNDNLNPNPGFGTHITGSTTGANGFDATPSGNPSMFTFDVASQSWDEVTNTENNQLFAGKPYRMMIRGDRSINVTSNSATPEPTILRAKGELTIGNFIQNDLVSSPGGFALIGNPYQAPIDIKQLLENSGGVNTQFFYVWDPTQNTRGAYVTVDANLNANNMSSSTANKYLQPWQGGFVKLKGNQTPYLNFTEDIKKVSTVTTTTFRAANSNTTSVLQVDLYEADAFENGNTAADGFTINFSDSFSNDVDEMDAGKFGNLDENLAIHKDNDFLSIEYRDVLADGDEVLFYNSNYRNSNYIYAITLPSVLGVTVYLEDNYLGTSTPLQNDNINYISFQVDEDIEESMASDRFKITVEENNLSADEYTLSSSMVLYPNPTNVGYVNIKFTDTIDFADASVQVYNLLGKKIYDEQIQINQKEISLSTQEFSKGVYLVKVNTGERSYTQKVIVQ